MGESYLSEEVCSHLLRTETSLLEWEEAYPAPRAQEAQSHGYMYFPLLTGAEAVTTVETPELPAGIKGCSRSSRNAALSCHPCLGGFSVSHFCPVDNTNRLDYSTGLLLVPFLGRADIVSLSQGRYTAEGGLANKK